MAGVFDDFLQQCNVVRREKGKSDISVATQRVDEIKSRRVVWPTVTEERQTVYQQLVFGCCH